MKHQNYKKPVKGLEFIDVYRVLELFEVTDPCLQHAIKKLLCAGQRGAKDMRQDVHEAIDTLQRRVEMWGEVDSTPGCANHVLEVNTSPHTDGNGWIWHACANWKPVGIQDDDLVIVEYLHGPSYRIPCEAKSIPWNKVTYWKHAQ